MGKKSTKPNTMYIKRFQLKPKRVLSSEENNGSANHVINIPLWPLRWACCENDPG